MVVFGRCEHANFIFPTLDPFAEPHHIRRCRSPCEESVHATASGHVSRRPQRGPPNHFASERTRSRHIDATPSLHAPCSVLSGEPCTPFCGVFNHGPCIPEIADAYNENLQVTIQSQPSHDDAAKYQRPDHDLSTIGDLFAALRSCWSPPPADAARQGMQMSVLFSFSKDTEECCKA